MNVSRPFGIIPGTNILDASLSEPKSVISLAC